MMTIAPVRVPDASTRQEDSQPHLALLASRGVDTDADPAGGTDLSDSAGLLEQFSMDRIAGLVELRGRSCSVIGASGVLAGWLAKRVGPSGRFYLVSLDGKDGRAPRVVPARRPDFLYERGELAYRPDRDQLLSRIVEDLEPGGTLLVEEWDVTAGVGRVLYAPEDRREASWRHRAFDRTCARLEYAPQTSRMWSMHLHEMLVRLGLVDVRTVVHAESWCGGSPSSRYDTSRLRRYWSRLVGPDMYESQLSRLAEAFDDPRVQVCSPLLYSISGHKPR